MRDADAAPARSQEGRTPAPLDEARIRALLKMPCVLNIMKETGSTNDDAKCAPLTDIPGVFLAEHQTAGRGRLGRSFESPAGTGIYVSFAVRPEKKIREITFVTMAAGNAVCRAIESVTGLSPGIKWVNDLFLNGKKVCGILTEAAETPGIPGSRRLVTGIGINCFPGSFPPGLAGTAGPLAEKEDAFDRSELAAAVINEVLAVLADPADRSFLQEYRRRSVVTGRDIIVRSLSGGSERPARAVAITDDGGLLVRYPDGTGEVLHTGEISIVLSGRRNGSKPDGTPSSAKTV